MTTLNKLKIEYNKSTSKSGPFIVLTLKFSIFDLIKLLALSMFGRGETTVIFTEEQTELLSKYTVRYKIVNHLRNYKNLKKS